MKTLLVTFGCSWTLGVGVGYTPGMSEDELKKIAWQPEICDEFSFRSLLAKKYNLVNKNFSEGGSSNQRQIRFAKDFFSSDEFDRLKTEFDKIIVLWGITSTARNEMWSTELNRRANFFYSDPLDLAKTLTLLSYNHDYEVKLLAAEIQHWNTFFKNLNISNLWFDTFNHHDYIFSNASIENLIFKNKNPRDLMSILAINNGLKNVNDQYHTSNWKMDSKRVEYLVKQRILNPFSHHPTRQGHIQIANILAEHIEAIL